MQKLYYAKIVLCKKSVLCKNCIMQKTAFFSIKNPYKAAARPHFIRRFQHVRM